MHTGRSDARSCPTMIDDQFAFPAASLDIAAEAAVSAAQIVLDPASVSPRRRPRRTSRRCRASKRFVRSPIRSWRVLRRKAVHRHDSPAGTPPSAGGDRGQPRDPASQGGCDYSGPRCRANQRGCPGGGGCYAEPTGTLARSATIERSSMYVDPHQNCAFFARPGVLTRRRRWPALLCLTPS